MISDTGKPLLYWPKWPSLWPSNNSLKYTSIGLENWENHIYKAIPFNSAISGAFTLVAINYLIPCLRTMQCDFRPVKLLTESAEQVLDIVNTMFDSKSTEVWQPLALTTLTYTSKIWLSCFWIKFVILVLCPLITISIISFFCASTAAIVEAGGIFLSGCPSI